MWLLLTMVAKQDHQERESQMVFENQFFLVDWLFISVGLASIQLHVIDTIRFFIVWPVVL